MKRNRLPSLKAEKKKDVKELLFKSIGCMSTICITCQLIYTVYDSANAKKALKQQEDVEALIALIKPFESYDSETMSRPENLQAKQALRDFYYGLKHIGADEKIEPNDVNRLCDIRAELTAKQYEMAIYNIVTLDLLHPLYEAVNRNELLEILEEFFQSESNA